MKSEDEKMNKKVVVGLEEKLAESEITRPALHGVSRISTSLVQRLHKPLTVKRFHAPSFSTRTLLNLFKTGPWRSRTLE
jgi:hypothetical protein